MDNVEIINEKETTQDVIKKIISREKEKNSNFEDAFFVTDLGDVCKNMKLWRQKLPRVEPFYAVKCNDDTNVLATLVKLGSSFDCSSKDEMSKVLSLGTSPSSIVYAHPIKQPKFIRYAAEKGVNKRN